MRVAQERAREAADEAILLEEALGLDASGRARDTQSRHTECKITRAAADRFNARPALPGFSRA